MSRVGSSAYHIAPLVLVSAFWANSAASQTICNKSDYLEIEFALGYPVGGSWVSSGWWTVAQGECTEIAPPLTLSSKFFYYARSGNSVWSDNESPYHFCIHPTQGFNEIDQKKKPCPDGYETRQFHTKSRVKRDDGSFADFSAVTLTGNLPATITEDVTVEQFGAENSHLLYQAEAYPESPVPVQEDLFVTDYFTTDGALADGTYMNEIQGLDIHGAVRNPYTNRSCTYEVTVEFDTIGDSNVNLVGGVITESEHRKHNFTLEGGSAKTVLPFRRRFTPTVKQTVSGASRALVPFRGDVVSVGVILSSVEVKATRTCTK